MSKSRPLRRRVIIPLLATFLLLWLAMTALLTVSGCRELEQRMVAARLEFDQRIGPPMKLFHQNEDFDLGYDARAVLTYQLSSLSNQLWEVDGGMAVGVQGKHGFVVNSQLAYGIGNNNDTELLDNWYFDLDSGLDDAGQLAFARWLISHRQDSWQYHLYPPDDWTDGRPCTYLQVTGEEQPGNVLVVDRLELLYPDGSTELITETDHRSKKPVIHTFNHVQLCSVLLPTYGSRGDGYTDMENHLAHFRTAQAALDPALGGEGGPSTGKTGSYTFENKPQVEVAYDYELLPTAFRKLLPTYLSTLALTIAAALLLARRLSQKVTRPAEQLCTETAAGHCTTDGPVLELNALADAFNKAQARLEEQLERERQFTRDAAHELKTPLAVVQAHAEALKENIRPDKTGEYWSILLDETERMNALVSRLLELSRLEAGLAPEKEIIALDDLIRETAQPFFLPMERRGMALTLELTSAHFPGNRQQLKEITENLLSNALRYGSPGDVRVTLSQTSDKLILTVDNDGSGIPEEILPHLFEPFRRADKARSRADGGTGLGLAIVKAAAELHGGSCSAENRAGGVRFTVNLPFSGKEDPK